VVAVFALPVLMLSLTYRKPKKLTLRSIGVTMEMSLLTVIFFSSIIGYQTSIGVLLLMAFTGGALGWFGACTTEGYIENI
jgi:hypothetical protein